MTHSATASIEIACSPDIVRAKFLDFSSIPQYHSTFFLSMTPARSGNLVPGEKMDVQLVGMGTMEPTILANAPSHFAWRGNIPLVFGGDHTFYFTPSTKTPGGTTFIQEESLFGALAFLMGHGWVAKKAGDMRAKTERNWDAYNRDFKAWCEKASTVES
ncbi:hypothetical protein ACEQ8H_004074 [Pleosporales sp. CAS-2024a]